MKPTPSVTTSSTREFKTFEMEGITIDDLKKVAFKQVVGTKTKGRKGFFERFMNGIGWYRQSEWYLIDINKINIFKKGL